MIDNQFFDELAKKFSGLMPEAMQQFKADMEKNFKAIMQNAFSKMDLVTRDEFDVQANVLKRTREKLEDLQKRVAELEKQVLTQKDI